MRTNLYMALIAFIAVICCFAYAATTMAQTPVPRDLPGMTPEPLVKTALLKSANGKPVGEAQFTETKGGVLITLNLYGLSPGEHAFHIHEKADCSPPDTFQNAGAHLNPQGHPHGFMNEGGPHAGDMPNIFVDANGAANAHVMNARITLDEEEKDGRALVLDNDGAAIVIHEKPDDYAGAETGNAGARIACGAIQ